MAGPFPNINPQGLRDAGVKRKLSEAALDGSGIGKFVLVNLDGGGTFVFDFFPTAPISGSRRANWPEQETTIGTRPLFYMNRDPRKPEVMEVWADKTDTNESLTPEIEALYALQDEIAGLGAPPRLLAMWGDRQEVCVLEELRHEEHMHSPSGNPIRVKFSLTLKEVQH
jgi:hypothetical protein